MIEASNWAARRIVLLASSVDDLLEDECPSLPTTKRSETIMSFGRKSDVHKHLIPKHPLLSHKMVEDNEQQRIVEPAQDEQMRLGDPPTEREEPKSAQN